MTGNNKKNTFLKVWFLTTGNYKLFRVQCGNWSQPKTLVIFWPKQLMSVHLIHAPDPHNLYIGKYALWLYLTEILTQRLASLLIRAGFFDTHLYSQQPEDSCFQLLIHLR